MRKLSKRISAVAGAAFLAAAGAAPLSELPVPARTQQ